ncbi:hypothetical protein GF420_02825 [candidate division GN15 bacterium]|nr:hypothetical protein [candidate division GN15 bacterium]
MDGKLHMHRTVGGLPNDQATNVRDLDLMVLLHDIIRYRRTIMVLVGAAVLVASLLLFTTPNRYTSYATILPSGETQGIASLRSLVGLGGGIMPTGENSSFLFPNVLNSQLVRDEVLAAPYNVPEHEEKPEVRLSEYFGESNPDRLRRKLAAVTEVSTDSKTGQIKVSVETLYPSLSQQIVAEYVRQLEVYNREKRRSTAQENAEHLASQLVQTQQELQAAEDALRTFRSANRDWASSTNPDILYELSRLQREINVHTAAFRLLQENYQLAQFEAHKDVPIVRLLDRPSFPTEKSGPRRLVSLVAVTMLSTLLATIGVIAFTHGSRRSRQTEFGRLRDAVREAFPRSSMAINRVRKLVRSGTRVVS